VSLSSPEDPPDPGIRPVAVSAFLLSTSLLWEVAVVDGIDTTINDDLNKVRSPGPLLVGSRMRLHASTEVKDITGDAEVVHHRTHETEGQTKAPVRRRPGPPVPRL